MKAIYAKKSVCDCGYAILRDEIPLGKVYNIDYLKQEPTVLVCGGCGKENHLISVYDVDAKDYLPMDIFRLDVEQTLSTF